jgi:hypothetical protein
MDTGHRPRRRHVRTAAQVAARYRAQREKIEPLIRLLVDLAALAALLHSRGSVPAAARDRTVDQP